MFVPAQYFDYAQDASGDERGVNHRTKHYHQANVLTSQALTQHKGALFAYGDNQAQRQAKGLDTDGSLD